MSNQSMESLDDDCLLAIFTRLNVIDKLGLRSVCKRWLELSEYNLFLAQTALGTVSSFSCLNSNHIVYSRDVIDRLFTNGPVKSVFKGKFDISPARLEIILSKCPELKSLVLKFAKAIGDDIAELIGQYCPQLEHLDLSVSIFYKKNNVLQILSNHFGSHLLHLNLLGCDGLTENSLGDLLNKCTKLEEFVIGRNGRQITGRFLSYFNSDIRLVSIYGIDEFTNNGITAIASLASGRGQGIEELKVKGQLSVALIKKIVEKFPHLKSLECGDFFTDAWIDASHTAIGAAISQLSHLQRISFELPELIQFDGNILEIMRGCSQLRSFKMMGGPINDFTVQLLCKWCPFLEKVALVYTKYFPSQRIRPSGEGLTALANLKNLTYLAINGTHITDNALSYIMTNCKDLSLVDVRDSPGISESSFNACFEAAVHRPDKQLQVFISGTGMGHHYDRAEMNEIIPRNLEIIETPREEIDDDIEYEDEEFEIEGRETFAASNGAAGPSPGNFIMSDQYHFEQPEDGIRYCLEDLDLDSD